MTARRAYDVAVDLGTANVRVFARGRGLVADEPSIVRVRKRSRRTVAVGRDALVPPPRTRATELVSPVRRGVVVDVDAAATLLSGLLGRAGVVAGATRPAVLACVPSDATDDDTAALRMALDRAGASCVTLVPEPLAAAIGAGVDVASPYASMLIDVGAGVTDVAVIRAGSIEVRVTVRAACDDVWKAVSDRVREHAGAAVTPAEAERLLGAAYALDPRAPLDVRGPSGRGRRRGVIAAAELRAAAEPVFERVISAVRSAWRLLDAHTSVQVIESGVCLSGGGATLPALCERIAAGTGLDVRRAPQPLYSVIEGASWMASLR